MTTTGNAEQDLDPVSMLKWYAECGVDETISNTSTNWFEVSENIKINQPVSGTSSPASKTVSPPPLSTHKENIESAQRVAAEATTLDELKEAILAIKKLEYAPHLEVETYTWDVLPESGEAISLVDGFARELTATQQLLDGASKPDKPEPLLII